MALILSIETATPVCSVALANGTELIDLSESNQKNAHSQVISVFIDQLLRRNGMVPGDLSAIAVSMGPGSYTGLRIGVSTAKGLCYALDKPLISVDTLEAMAVGMRAIAGKDSDLPLLFAPMIDARRMEVFTALFDTHGRKIRATKAEIIDSESFREFKNENTIWYAGDGAGKCTAELTPPHFRFLDGFNASTQYMIPLAIEKFHNKQFENTAYFEPYYLKDFVAGVPKVKGLH